MSDDESSRFSARFSYKRNRRSNSSSENEHYSSSDDDEGKLSSKRSRNRARTTEDAMLGVFGESDDEGLQLSSDEERDKKRKLKPVEFVRRKEPIDSDQMDIDEGDGEEEDEEEDFQSDSYHVDGFIGFSRKNSSETASKQPVSMNTYSSTIKSAESAPLPAPAHTSSSLSMNSTSSTGVGIGGSSISTNRKFAEMFRKDMKVNKTIGSGESSSAVNRVRFTDDKLEDETMQTSFSELPEGRTCLGNTTTSERTEEHGMPAPIMPAPIMPAPIIGKDFAKFEKHTKGFGAKYLEKFSFKGRLGKREQGIAQPIDVQVRPNMLGLGYGGFKEVTKANLVIARDRAAGHGDAIAAAQAAAEAATVLSNGSHTKDDNRGAESHEEKLARRAKRDEAAALRTTKDSIRMKAKKEYQSAAELLAADEASSFGKNSTESSTSWPNDLSISSGGVIDMRGPSVRVLSSLSDAGVSYHGKDDPDVDESKERKRPGRDLIISLGRLLSESEIDLRRANARLRTHESSAKVLEREFALAQSSLSRKLLERNELSSAREAFDLFYESIKSGIKSSGVNSSEEGMSQTSVLISVLENSATSFERIKEQHKRAFTLLNLNSSGPLVVQLILKRLVKTWEPPVNVIDASHIKNQATEASGVTVFVDDDGDICDENTARLVKSLWHWAIVLAYPPETDQTNLSSEVHLFSRPRVFDPSDVSEANEKSQQLEYEKNRADKESSAKYFQAVVESTIISSLKSAINAAWNPISSPRALISLIEAVSPRPSSLYFKEESSPLVIAEPVSNLAIREVLSLCVLPRLLSSIESWSPATDPLPVQDWTLPWAMPHLLGNDARAQLFPPLRFKLHETLANWHPNDDSAITVLKPWANGVWDKHDKLLGDLIVRTIIPKFITLLRDIKIDSLQNNSQDCIEMFSWITRWGNLLPSFHFSCLLEGEFLRKWYAVLTIILGLSHTSRDAQESRCSVPDFHAVLTWYEEWRPAFPSWIFSPTRDERLLSLFSLSLDLIEISLNVRNWEDINEVYVASTCAAELLNSRGVGPDSKSSYALSIERRNAVKANESIEHPHRAQRSTSSKSVNGVIAGLGQSKLSFREFVETTASASGFGLVPTRLRGGDSIAVDSSQVFLLGDAGQGITVQLDRGVIFVQDKSGWTPMSVEEAIEAARAKRAIALQK